MKERSKYQLSDNEDLVDPNTIVFEAFGGKNYSDSPKYIYEYMQKHYPHLNYIWVFSKPENNNIPGNATKVKKDLKLIMMPMLKRNIGLQTLDYLYI